MSDPRTAKHWVIKVNGSTKVDVGPGENVEIGRRPLRPMADDGHSRLEIDDDTRSMSKRHAVFAVAANGGASVTDMNSTNGSYVVGENGLKPLKPNQDFILPDSPMRLQFGDVPVDFVRIDVEESSVGDNPVTDLFDYALAGVENVDIEPDMADMSVDDILNLRAGEPTTAFSAADVAGRLETSGSAGAVPGSDSHKTDGQASLDSQATEETPDKVPLPGAGHDAKRGQDVQNDHAIDQISLNVMAPQTGTADIEARDLFKDALQREADEKAAASRQQVASDGPGPVQTDTGLTPANKDLSSQAGQTPVGEQKVRQEKSEQQAMQARQGMPQQQSASQQATDMPRQYTLAQNTASQPSQLQQNMSRQASQQGIVTATQPTEVRYTAPQQADEADGSGDVPGSSQQADGSRTKAAFVPMNASPWQSSGGARGGMDFTDSQNDMDRARISEERNKFMPPVRIDASSAQTSEVPMGNDGAADVTQTFKPVFEAGSVFEKVSNGEFNQPQPEVQVEGMSSEEAKRTTDFGVQFEMAKHPELLPFLAMNTSLYDDLYAWLSAVGNDDIDAALSQNSGYIEYRNEVGEGRKQ